MVIETLRQNEAVTRYLDSVVSAEDQLAIPSIVYYEIMRGFKAYNASRRLRQFRELYHIVVPLPLDDKAIAKAIDIYADLHCANLLIEDADIFIWYNEAKKLQGRLHEWERNA